jgi:GTP-binding protein
MFTDRKTIHFTGGRGGNGVVAWRREKYIPKGGPSGGNGGKGGSIYLQADRQILDLSQFRNTSLVKAKNGGDGGSNLKQGKNGEDLVLKIPCGTLVKDAETGEVLSDLTQEKESFLLCEGGSGGRGNHTFRSPTHQAPNISTPGADGKVRRIELELKLIADVGLIGMPNAGKSTLISSITSVKVKIAPYPFTTLHPNLGYIQFEDFSRIIIADIPGIIENAHADKGLGLSFLRHIERTSVLLFVIDVSEEEGNNPLADFKTLQEEIAAYDREILKKPSLLVLNKMDKENTPQLTKAFRKKYKGEIFEISALTGQGLEPLILAMQKLVPKKY